MAIEPLEVDGLEIVFVLGGPCAGKGYLCTAAESKLETIKHICMGDILRHERKRLDSPWAEEIQKQMLQGNLVRTELGIELLISSITKAVMNGWKRFIVDGFPRSIDQAILFESKVKGCKAAIVLQCSKAVMRERLRRRAETSGRIDDNEITFEKRYKGYLDQILPITERLEAKKIKIIEVSSEEDGEEGWKKFHQALELAFKLDESNNGGKNNMKVLFN